MRMSVSFSLGRGIDIRQRAPLLVPAQLSLARGVACRLDLRGVKLVVRRHRWHAILHNAIDVTTVPWTFWLSVCMSVMRCAQTTEDIDTISSAYNSTMSLIDCFKIWLTLFYPFLPKFCPNLTHPPVDFSVGDIRLKIVAE